MNWFRQLPDIFQHQVLKAIGHKSLIAFANAFPYYKRICIEPVYWDTMKNSFKHGFVTIEEIKIFIAYTNKCLKYLILEVPKYNSEDTRVFYEDLFENSHNLLHFDVKHVGDYNLVNKICKNLKNIKTLKIEWSMLDNHHLSQIADSYHSLELFFVSSDKKIDDGLMYFINTIKTLKGFGFRLDSLKDE